MTSWHWLSIYLSGVSARLQKETKRLGVSTDPIDQVDADRLDRQKQEIRRLLDHIDLLQRNTKIVPHAETT